MSSSAGLSFECSNSTVKEELLLLKSHYEINSFKRLNENTDKETYIVGILLPFYSEIPSDEKYWWAKMEAELQIPATFPVEGPILKIIKTNIEKESKTLNGKNGVVDIPFEISTPIFEWIHHLYIKLEHELYPKDFDRDIVFRDFEYPFYDPRHWGRPFNIKSTFRVKVIYGFKGNSGDGELTVDADDIITVHGESGEDWYIASKSDSNGNTIKGLVPKNYVERDLGDEYI